MAATAIQTTADRGGPVVTFTADAWRAFTNSLEQIGASAACGVPTFGHSQVRSVSRTASTLDAQDPKRFHGTAQSAIKHCGDGPHRENPCDRPRPSPVTRIISPAGPRPPATPVPSRPKTWRPRCRVRYSSLKRCHRPGRTGL